MNVRTYRARSVQEALELVRNDLGPDAAVLHTREVPLARLLGWLPGMRRIEVAASNDVVVPSRLPRPQREASSFHGAQANIHAYGGREYDQNLTSRAAAPNADGTDTIGFQATIDGRLTELQSMVDDLCRRTRVAHHDLPEQLFALYTSLIDVDIDERLARDLVERVRTSIAPTRLHDTRFAFSRLADLLESDIRVAGPIVPRSDGPTVVALVGPTGVGKTTTIAKLAANFRLRDRRRVGLITVDTYRIAAVEQLRTYADIIDLPMRVVTSPGDMHEALEQMADLEVLLVDTAGRSPRDEVRLRELKAVLVAANAEQTHLVLSAVSSASTLTSTAERFAEVGVNRLLLTKLDETACLGNVLPVIRGSGLPLSYVTNGQNVPDDIDVAEAKFFVRELLGAACEDGNA